MQEHKSRYRLFSPTEHVNYALLLQARLHSESLYIVHLKVIQCSNV